MAPRLDSFSLVYDIISVVDNPDAEARGRHYADWRDQIRAAMLPGPARDQTLHELERAILSQEARIREREEIAWLDGMVPEQGDRAF